MQSINNKIKRTRTITLLYIEIIAILLVMFFPYKNFVEIIVSFSLFAFPAFLYAVQKDKPIEILGLNWFISYKQCLLLFAFIVCIYPAINFLDYINNAISLPTSMADLERSLRASHISSYEHIVNKLLNINVGTLVLFFISMAAIPALFEELFFRGFLQNWLSEKINIHLTIIVVSIIFSLLHFDFYGFIARMCISILYGYIFYFTGSLWTTIIAHFMNNFIYVLIVYLQYNHNTAQEIGVFGGEGKSIFIGFISFLFVILFVFLMYRTSRNNITTTTE